MIHEIIKLFGENQEKYRTKEIGDGTHDLTKKVLEQIFGLSPKSSLISETNLFGDVMYDNFYSYEGSKKQGDKARRDFKCKINGQIVVVETEKLDNIGAGMKQIGGYMIKEDTNYGIVTDGYIWRFFKNGADDLDIYESLTLYELCSDTGKAKLQNFYNTYEFYINRLSSVVARPFEIQGFHQGLITTAERLVFDLRSIGLFEGNTKEIEKQEIQTAYSLIIQLLLIKIVQDKKKINLLKNDDILGHLKSQNYQSIFQSVESQISRLGKFYDPYHNQQDSLLDKILSHYKQGSRLASLELDSVRLFLDIYYFVYSFDFSQVKQDLFGAVYENYLKELYKDDDSKKGQVFTPPEIVDFMLDEIGYDVSYIQQIISLNLDLLKKNIDDADYNIDGLSIIDPACGSGTFLYKAAARIVNAIYQIRKTNAISDIQAGKFCELLICNNIVGFDIEPFPLYLAEMNILQTLLIYNVAENGDILNPIGNPIKIFSTNDSIAEFHDIHKSMKRDLEDLVINTHEHNLFSKRDNGAILGIKADIQDFDPEVIIDSIKLDKAIAEITKPIYIMEEKSLLSKQPKTFADIYTKDIKKNRDSLTKLNTFISKAEPRIFTQYKKNFESNYGEFISKTESKLKALSLKSKTRRTKFDFVVANPPYVRTVAFYDNEDLYGIDINDRKYTKIYLDGNEEMRIGSSKFNIYGYFYYLGFFLLKDGGKMSFINPRTFLFQPSFHKLRQFIKYNLFLHKLIDFNNGIVFYDRGVNGKIEVITDACISLITKKKQNTEYNVEILKYIGNQRLVNLEIFKNNNSGIISKNISEIVDYKGYRFYHYFKELQTKDSDFHFSIYSRIEKNKINKNRIGLPFIKPEGYYSNIDQAIGYFDYKNIGAVETYPTCEAIIDKQYKISRGSLTMLWSIETKKEHGIDFVFTDYKRLNQRDRFTSIGVSKIDNVPELYYLFGMFNSYTCQKYFIDEFGTNVNKTNLSLLKFPQIDSDAQILLKNKLIANSESIINLCKNGNTHIYTRGDVCHTELDIDSMTEKLISIKSEYLANIPYIYDGVSAKDPLPVELIAKLVTTSSLADLEAERDDIVRQLYGPTM